MNIKMTLLLTLLYQTVSAQIVTIEVNENDGRSDTNIINDTLDVLKTTKDKWKFDMLMRGAQIEVLRVLRSPSEDDLLKMDGKVYPAKMRARRKIYPKPKRRKKKQYRGQCPYF